MLRLLSGFALLFLAACSGQPSPGGSCQSGRDCVAGEICVAGACTTQKGNSGCSGDQDCSVGEWCDPVDRACKPIIVNNSDAGVPQKDASVGPEDSGSSTDAGTGCTTDLECGPPTNICESNQCVLGCTEPGGLTCTGGNTCDPATGRCVGPNTSCATDVDCMPGAPAQICINQMCVPGCGLDPGLCTAGTEVCDTNTGHCVPAPQPCADDAACSPPLTVCEVQQCVPGCGQAGGIQCAGATPDCDPATGRCIPAPGCTLDSQCTGVDEICFNGVCTLRCDAPASAGCGQDVCNPADGRCLPGNLPLGDQTCQLDDQCATGMCLGLNLTAGAIDVCTDPCGATSQCPLDFSCLSVSGMYFCLSENLFTPAATFDTPPGGACSTASNTCQTGWCNTGTNVCIETCSRNSDCGSFGGNCWTYEQDDMGTPIYDNLCVTQATLSAAGITCTQNSDCQSGVCNRYDNVCAPLCCRDADCGAAESCALYDLDADTGIKICAQRSATAGTGALGSTCTMPSDCESEVCAALDPTDANSVRKCSTLCCTDADCASLPLGGGCRPATSPIMGEIVGVCEPN